MVIVSNDWVEHKEGQKSMIDLNVIMANPGNFPINKSENTIKLNQVDKEETPSQGSARIILHCQPNSHPFDNRTIILEPNIEVKVGRSIARSRATDGNAIFDCKVLSRNHAVLWYDDGQFYVKDTRSSNGTFINERRISQSDPEKLNSGDVVKFGVDVIENSRKEVHGCIIACVKLYLPDGREAISMDNSSRSTSDGYISFGELHHIHHYIQEVAQREKMLEVKMHDIQNVLDTTRKNTSTCWQAMIDEDRLLNRIDILEKKLQLLQRNSPVDRLKDDIMKLQDDKFLYQNNAKEALRKVYQERMEAMQKLSTIERALCSSEDECSLLRDQLLHTQQNLEDVNTRLLHCEAECKEYKYQIEKSQKEVEELEAQSELDAQLNETKQACEQYKNQIGALLNEKAELIRKLNSMRKDDNSNEGDNIQIDNNTIMKWFEQSDLNQQEGSSDIIKAICNESDSSEEDSPEKLQTVQQDNQLDVQVLNDKNRPEQPENISVLSTANENNRSKNIINHVLLESTVNLLKEIHDEIFAHDSSINNSYKETVRSESNEEKPKPLSKEVISESDLEKAETDNKENLIENKNTIKSKLDNVREKINQLSEGIDFCNDEKDTIDNILQENVMNSKNIAFNSNDLLDGSLDDIVKEDIVAINNVAVQQEEELVLYKEKYDNILNENLKLKDEIAILKGNVNDLYSSILKKILTYIVVIIAVIFYFIFSYL